MPIRTGRTVVPMGHLSLRRDPQTEQTPRYIPKVLRQGTLRGQCIVLKGLATQQIAIRLKPAAQANAQAVCVCVCVSAFTSERAIVKGAQILND